MSSNNLKFLDSAVALAGITALLYCMDTVFYNAYIRELGLNSEMLDRNFQQSLYLGFLRSFSPIFNILAIIISSALIYSYLILPALIKWLKKGVAQKRKYLKFRNFFINNKDETISEKIAKRKSLKLLVYILIPFVSIFFLAYLENKGKNAGKDTIKEIYKNKYDKIDLITVKIDEQNYQLILLVCGARNCAGVDPVSKQVHYFPQQHYFYSLPLNHKK